MRTRFAVLALATTLIGTLAATPLTHPASAQTAGSGLSLPNVTGTLARGDQFSGSVTITRLTTRAGELVADGAVTGTTTSVSPAPSPTPDDIFTVQAPPSGSASATAVMQTFREIPLTLLDPDGGACDALNVDLSTIFLDQTGVQLDLAPTTLDLATLPRANRPLGNLLCAVASLAEPSPGGSQAALLNELLPVVNRALSVAAP
jgi:hypothetical protein